MDSLFFLLSKVYWLFGKPDTLLLVVLTLGFVLACWSAQNKRRFKLLGLTVVLCWAIAILPISSWLFSPLDYRFAKIEPPVAEEIAGVIVLGGAENIYRSAQQQSLQLNEMGERITELAALAATYPQLPVIYTSGSGSVRNQNEKGADYVKNYFDRLNFDNIVYERESRNTYENALYSKELLTQSDKPWLLVTSAFHMPRSVGIFSKQGIKVLPYPVDYWVTPGGFDKLYIGFADNLVSLNMATREWIGLTVYWFTGKTSSWLPSEADLLIND